MKKRLIAGVLAALMLFLPVSFRASAEQEGAQESAFYLAAVNEGIIIAPTRIPYTEGQTVKDALLSSQYSFSDLEAGFVNVIQGVTGNYTRYDNNGGFDLSVMATDIEAFFFNTFDFMTEEQAALYANLIAAMADFNLSENGVTAYEDAQAAYAAAETLLLSPEGDYASGADALREAMQRYIDKVLSNPELETNVAFGTVSGAPLDGFTFTVSNGYGGQWQFVPDEAVVLKEGDYSFILESGYNRAEGVMMVGTDGSVSVGGVDGQNEILIYDGQWLTAPVLLDNSAATGQPYPSSPDSTDSDSVHYIPDTKQTVYVYEAPGSGVDGVTYTTAHVKLYAVYTRTDGTLYDATRTWSSYNAALASAAAKGPAGNTVRLEARHECDGYTQIQSHYAIIERTPSLSSLGVMSNGAELSLGFSPEITEYAFNVTSDTVEVMPKAFGAYSDGYSVAVNSEPVAENGSATIPVDGSADVSVTVALGENNVEYSLRIQKIPSVEVSISHEDSAVTVELFNAAGSRIGESSHEDNTYTYALVTGESYTYIATKDEYRHSKQTFTAVDGLSIAASVDETGGDWLTWLWLGDTASRTGANYYLGNGDDKQPSKIPQVTFEPQQHEYSVYIPDTISRLYVWAQEAGYAITAFEIGTAINKAMTATGQMLNNLIAVGDVGGSLTLHISKSSGAVTYYQEYIISLLRQPSATNMTLEISGVSEHLFQVIRGEATETGGFLASVADYQANAARAVEQAVIEITPYSASYHAEYNGGQYLTENGKITVPVALNPEEDTEVARILLCSQRELTVPRELTVEFIKRNLVAISIDACDGDGVPVTGALVAVYSSKTGDRVWQDESGDFMLIDSMSYTYSATCYGYIGQSGQFTVSEAGDTDITITLVRAADSSAGEGVTSSWPNFRGSDSANGVVNDTIPTNRADTMLSWAKKLGEGYGSGATGCPILITEDGVDYLVTYAGTSIIKIEAVTGTIVATGQMAASSNFAINSPTFAEGMIFVGLSNGRVQAFDAKTLASLWVYTDPLGGQPNCPIVYKNGYIYTGFWQGEDKDASFVCLSVTDEYPEQGGETKMASWRYASRGGFYWAGAYVDDGFLLVGTDDGHSQYTSETAALLCIDPKTGELLDSITGLHGDVRSSIAYDDATNRFYFTSKGGFFYSVAVEAPDGTYKFNRESFRAVPLYNYASNPSAPPMSTCTPVVYNGRAYIGVSGVGQFDAYSGHNLTVIDLASWSIAYTVRTQGYPQTSGLLTTAHEGDGGYVYVYFFDNYTPGKLRVLKDSAGQTQPLLTEFESYTDKGVTTNYETPYVLFTPSGSQAQYAICSPISDAYGTMYFKNDSAYMMSLTSTVEALEITKLPDKTAYQSGELFDPAGMEVTIHYTNGTSRVLPAECEIGGVEIEYFAWSKEELSAENEEFTITFPYAMYQNGDTPGQQVTAPAVTLDLTIESDVLIGDLNGDGKLNTRDVIYLQQYINKIIIELDEQAAAAADMNGDGKVNTRDLIQLQNQIVG